VEVAAAVSGDVAEVVPPREVGEGEKDDGVVAVN